MSSRTPNSGNIKINDLTEILISLHNAKATGSLVLQKKDVVKAIYLKEGLIVYASSNHPGDRLGELFLRKKKIDRDQFHRSVEILRNTGKQQGTILVEEGYITAKDLYEGLKEQIREIILSLFLWDNAQYHFIEEELPRQAVPLQIDMAELVSDILKQMQAEAG